MQYVLQRQIWGNEMFWRLRAQWHADRLGFMLRDSHRFDITETIQKPGNVSLRLPRYFSHDPKKKRFFEHNVHHLVHSDPRSIPFRQFCISFLWYLQGGHPFPRFCSGNHVWGMLFQVAVAAAASTGSGLGAWYTLICRKIHDMKLLWQIICKIYCVVKYVLILNISIHHTYETPM